MDRKVALIAGMAIDMEGLEWSDISPDCGLPECVCSHCGKMIDEDDMPIRAWAGEGQDCKEIRFHQECFERRVIHRVKEEMQDEDKIE